MTEFDVNCGHTTSSIRVFEYGNCLLPTDETSTVIAVAEKAVAFTCFTVLEADRYTLSLASISPHAVKDLFIVTTPEAILAASASVVSFVA